MDQLSTPRYLSAQFGMDQDQDFWKAVVNQSDVFAYETANAEKGGPFGAQLWLYQPKNKRYVLVGTAEKPEDSNAVLSKGIASAHAEAESLSPEKREAVIEFLKQHKDENWQIVQVSSGESCPSCRAKQVAFADELVQLGLMQPKDFNVVFKATYEQTHQIALFNDISYDQTFRAINYLNILDENDRLFGLEKALKTHDFTAKQIEEGELVYNPVDLVSAADVPEEVKVLFDQTGKQPFAVIVQTTGEILSSSVDRRNAVDDVVNHPEKTAVVLDLHNGAGELREQGDKFETWDLDHARLYTNIRDIGPIAYSECLWSNIASILVIDDYTDDGIECAAQEIPGVENVIAFQQVCTDYDGAISPLRVVFNGDEEEASVAHLMWRAKIEMEKLKRRQAEQVVAFKEQGKQIEFIDGGKACLSSWIDAPTRNSHYNGKTSKKGPDLG